MVAARHVPIFQALSYSARDKSTLNAFLRIMQAALIDPSQAFVGHRLARRQIRDTYRWRANSLILNSLLSVFFLIAIGFALKRVLLTSDEAWNSIERLSYYVLFPALMIKTLGMANLANAPIIPLATALIAAILSLTALLVLTQPLLQRRFGIDGPAFTSVYQGSVRWNAFVGIAMAANLYGSTGTALASIAIAGLIPVLNILSVWVLRKWGSGTSGSMLRGLITNPFIIGSLGGILLNISGLTLPKSVELSLDALAQCALAMGLLLVGAGLRLGDLKRPSFALIFSTALRLIALPLIGFGFATLLGLTGPAMAVVVICLGVPSASAAYILARQMGGDAPLMAAILTLQTVVSFITLPLLLITLSG